MNDNSNISPDFNQQVDESGYGAECGPESERGAECGPGHEVEHGAERDPGHEAKREAECGHGTEHDPELGSERGPEHEPKHDTLWQRIRNTSPRVRTINAIAIIVAAVLAIIALRIDARAIETDERFSEVHDDYVVCSDAAYDLRIASDYLTTEARLFAITAERKHMDNYFEELLVTNRRGKAVDTLHELSRDQKAKEELERALKYSNELTNLELYTMRLTAEANGIENLPDQVASVQLSDADAALSASGKTHHAEELLLGEEYKKFKDDINSSAHRCSESVLTDLRVDSDEKSESLQSLLGALHVIILLLLGIVVFVIFTMIFLVLWPIASYAQNIKENRPLDPSGASELRYLARAYNVMHDAVQKRTRQLRYDAERDALTGLYNRSAFNTLLAGDTSELALLIVDVDKFKGFNDTYGHKTGDEVLKKVAQSLTKTFRSTDYICRIGGDEFAVFATRVRPELRPVLAGKSEQLATLLADTDDGLPCVTLSVGIAFGENLPGDTTIYTAADKALYVVKDRGRNGFAFYGED